MTTDELIARLMDIVSDLGWDLVMVPDEYFPETAGAFVIGNPDTIDGLILDRIDVDYYTPGSPDDMN